MQIKFIALSAFAAGAIASPAAEISVPASIESILVTALPTSALAFAIASPSAFSKKIASEVEAGKPPAWLTKLPPAAESYLLHEGSTNTNTTSHASTAKSNSTTTAHHHSNHTMTTGSSSSSLSIPTGPGPVMTSSSTTASASHKSMSNGVPTPASTSTTSSSSGGAAVATAVFGAGMVGAMGVLGVLAL